MTLEEMVEDINKGDTWRAPNRNRSTHHQTTHQQTHVPSHRNQDGAVVIDVGIEDLDDAELEAISKALTGAYSPVADPAIGSLAASEAKQAVIADAVSANEVDDDDSSYADDDKESEAEQDLMDALNLLDEVDKMFDVFAKARLDRSLSKEVREEFHNLRIDVTSFIIQWNDPVVAGEEHHPDAL